MFVKIIVVRPWTSLGGDN